MWEGVHHMLTNSGCYQLVSLLWESILFRCVFIHSCGHVWMWELDCEEGWAPKTWCFWTVVLEKTLESPLDCKEIQPVHSEDQPGISLEGMMLKLKLRYFVHLMRRIDLLEKTLMLGGIGGRRRRERQRMRWLDGITDWWTWIWVNSGIWWRTGRHGMLWFMGSQRVGHDWAPELNWKPYFEYSNAKCSYCTFSFSL